jgi:hypothetical protein
MRVIESPLTGDVVQAATDDELVRRLVAHYADEDKPLDEAEARRLVGEQAYDATDS